LNREQCDLWLLSLSHETGKGVSAAIPAREDIETKYKWDLQPVFGDDGEWENQFSWVENNYQRYREFEKTLGISAAHIAALLVFDEQLSVVLEKLHLYAMLQKDTDLGDSRYYTLYSRINTLHTKVAAASAFIRPELLSIDSAVLESFIESDTRLHLYRHFFSELSRAKAHTLRQDMEELLAGTGEITGLPYDTFSIFTNADMKFPIIKDAEGSELQISHARYQSALYSTDRSFRERVYKAYYKPYVEHINTLTALFNGNLKTRMFYARARLYGSAREASLDRNNIPFRVYDNLIGAINEHLAPLQRWIHLKKKVMQVEEIHPYDLYVNVFQAEQERVYTFEEGKELVTQSLAILGNDYQELLTDIFNGRRIDVFETKGKRSGAYSTGTTFGVKPYILLNWNGLLNDVFTLAHEIGHNIHSLLAITHQPYVYADYSIFLAEIASTFNESLLQDFLLKTVTDLSQRRILLERYLNNVTATMYRQTMFAEFERDMYNRAENGEAFNAESLRGIYRALFHKYHGGAVNMDIEEEYTWARVPHFYYNFYVYQYATGFAASEALAQQVIQAGKLASKAYLEILKAGKSDYPLTLLTKAGIDMTSPEPALAVTRKMNAILDELESII
jgi:oligoendopeptidase F